MLLKDNDRAPPCPVELEQHGGGFEFRIDLLPDAQEVVGKLGFDHAQKPAQALIVDIGNPGHVVSAQVDRLFDFIGEAHGKNCMQVQSKFSANLR